MPYKDPELKKRYNEAYYLKNKDEVKARSLAYYKDNLESRKESQRAYYMRTRKLKRVNGEPSDVQKSYWKGLIGRTPWNKGTGGVSLNSQGYLVKKVEGKNVAHHRIVMAEMVGRPLGKKEVVHHWDEDRANNSPSNLALFRRDSAHRRLHAFANRHGIPVSELRFDQPWLTADAQPASL